MGLLKDIVRNKYLYLLGLPGLIFLAVFAYIPMVSYLIAFKDYKLSDGLWGSKFVGFKNFEFFFSGQEWLRVTFNTLFLNTLFLIFGLGVAVLLALFLNELRNKYIKKLIQSVVFLPYFVSWVVISFMVLAILTTEGGLLNKLLEALGLKGVNWYGNADYWPAILTFIYVWKFAGYNSIIFLGAITGISEEYYESARIDGATRLKQVIHITLPLIVPTIMVMALLGIGRIFYGDFGMIYGIVGDIGILYKTTDVIDTYSFRALRQLGNFSMSSAVILYQSVMGLVIVLLFNKLAKKFETGSGLF